MRSISSTFSGATPAYASPVDELPQWEEGTPALVCVTGPHSIPVSTAVRVSGSVLRFALGGGRETLARLRGSPEIAVSILGRGIAFTAYGSSEVVRERLEAAPGVVAVQLRVEQVQDHLADGRTEMLDGARWRWLDSDAAEVEPEIRAELRALD
jgi:hypothetical protein